MASNDLMMRIQLLVDSGRASNELRRLQGEINSLTGALKSLESARIAPLTQEIDALKRAASSLRSVHLGNFSSELDAIKTAFTGLRIPTTVLDDLRNKYAALNREIGAGTLKTLQGDLARVKTELIQTRGNLVPLQNEIRKIRSEKAFDKLSTDRLNASLKVSRADLALLRNELQEALKTPSGLSSRGRTAAVIANEIDTLNKSILNSAKQIALAQQAQFNRAEPILRLKQRELANQQNLLNLKQQEIREITNKVSQQKSLEQSLQREIQQLTRLATAQANARKALLQADLASARGTRAGLQSRLREIQDEAKAEIQRIRAVDEGTRALARQKQELTTLGRLFRGGSGIAREFGAALRFALGPQMAGFAAAGSIIQLISGFFAANKEIENLNRGLNAITGAGTLYFEELRRIANATGQSMLVVTDSFLQLVSASKGTRLEGEATRKIFESVSRALVITGADAVRSRRAFLALAQMMSKGQVYAEELRQQLSEALPGSVQIFAKALQITPQAMLELMKQGKVSADSLILFAEQLGKEFGAVGEDMFTFSQKAAVLQNELQRLFVEIGKTGIWRALGDALLGARDLIKDLADGVGTFGDTAKREIGAVVAAFRTLDLSGVTDAFSAISSGWLDFVKSTYDQLFELIRQIPQLIGELRGVASQLGTRLDIGAPPTSGGWFDWLNELDRKFGTTSTDLRRYWEDFTNLISRPVPVPDFSEWQQQAGKGFTLQINRLQRELQRLGQQQINLETRGVGPDDSAYQKIARRIEEINHELRYLERESVRAFDAARKAAEKKNQELAEGVRLTKEQRAANQEIEQNRIFLQGFDPKVRTSIRDAYQALQEYQRSSETLLRLEKESEQAIINRVRSAKKILDVQNDIKDATQRAVDAQRSFDQNRARDAREVLQLTLSQADALRQAEENSKRLREGREKAGVYFTPEQRKASEDELQAFKLRKQAQEELAKAAKETNRETQEGNLENAKLLLEQANALLVSAGNTYLVKQNNEELLKIQKQLSAEVKDQRKQEESRRRGLELLAQAQDLLGKSQADIPASVRDVYLEQVEDLAKKAQAIFAEIGFFEGLEKTARIRGGTAQILEDSAGELQKRIDDVITKFNAQTKKDADSAVVGLSAAATGLLALQRELEQKIVETTTDAAREQLQSRLNDLRRDLKTLKREYLQVFKRLQDVGKTPTQIEFVSKTDPANLPKPPPIQVEVQPVIKSQITGEQIKSFVLEFGRRLLEKLPSVPPVPVKIEPVIPPDMQERLRDQVRPVDVPVDAESLKEAAQAATNLGDAVADVGNAIKEWDFDEVEQSLWSSLRDGRAMASVVGDIREEQFRANEVAAKYEQQAEENRNRSLQLIAAVRELAGINLTPKQQTMEFKSNEEKFLTSLAKVRGTTESVRQEVEKPMALDARLSPNFSQPFQQVTQLASVLQTTVESTKYQNLDRVKQLLQEINALQAQQPQVSFQPIVDSAELQAKRKQLELELAKPVSVPVGVEITQGTLESAKQAIQDIPKQNIPLTLVPNLRTELLNQEFRKIDKKFDAWNRIANTGGGTSGLVPVFRNAANEAQNFNTLVDQTNQKMRAIQQTARMTDEQIKAALEQKPEIEVQIDVDKQKAEAEFKKFNEETQRLLEDPDPIRLLVDNRNVVEAQKLIGEIQADLKKLKDAGATNIEVRFDEKTGKLTVTADTSQADASVKETIAKINASTAVLNVRVRYNDPGFTPRNTSVNVTAKRWGGSIPGYGGGDRVRALLEPGEFVLRKEAVRAIGLDALFAMNRHKRLPRAPRVRDTVSIPRMASGGPVMGSPITINVPGRQPIRVSGSRDQAEALANLLTSVGRAL